MRISGKERRRCDARDRDGAEKERDTGYTRWEGKRGGGEPESGEGDRLIVPALALAEHIDEVTLPTRPSYAKWTLQTGRPLNLICTWSQLPVKPRPVASAESLPRTLTAVCLFTDRFPSRVPFPSTNIGLMRAARPDGRSSRPFSSFFFIFRFLFFK